MAFQYVRGNYPNFSVTKIEKVHLATRDCDIHLENIEHIKGQSTRPDSMCSSTFENPR